MTLALMFNLVKIQRKSPSMLSKENRYTFVAEIKAVDLNHCFEVGNIGPEENITRRRSMASLSVGDVLIDWKTGEQHLIKNIGFEKLNIAA